MIKLDSMLKSRDIILPTKVHLVKAIVITLVMYGCESWTVKKAECQRIDAFELWCWRRLLKVLWNARRFTQSIVNEINPDYSLEGLMLKLQYFGHLMRRADSLKNTLMLERLKAGWEGNDGGQDSWMASLMQWTWVWVGPGRCWYRGKPGVLSTHEFAKIQTWLSDWTKLSMFENVYLYIL